MVVSHIKICSFKLRSQPQEASSKTRRSCSYITRQCATMYNALFECISRGPADWEMLPRLKEIFWVQYKLSSIDCLCGIMFITTEKKCLSLIFFRKSKKQGYGEEFTRKRFFEHFNPLYCVKNYFTRFDVPEINNQTFKQILSEKKHYLWVVLTMFTQKLKRPVTDQ